MTGRYLSSTDTVVGRNYQGCYAARGARNYAYLADFDSRIDRRRRVTEPLGARLKPLQGAGIALGLILVVLPWLPPGRYALWGGSYEKAEEAQVVATTNEQFNRVLDRIAVLERRIRILETPTAAPAERRAAQEADLQARRNYAIAARNAATARRHLVDRLDVDRHRTLLRKHGGRTASRRVPPIRRRAPKSIFLLWAAMITESRAARRRPSR